MNERRDQNRASAASAYLWAVSFDERASDVVSRRNSQSI